MKTKGYPLNNLATHTNTTAPGARRNHAAPLPKNSAKRQRHLGSTQPQTTTTAGLQPLVKECSLAQPPHVSADKNPALLSAEESARKDRYYLQDIAQTLIVGNSRLSGCGKLIAYDKSIAAGVQGKVKIMKTVTSAGHDAFHYKGLTTCGLVWLCPVCAQKISEKRRLELAPALDKWIADGHGVTMATLTAPHYINTHLDKHLDGILAANRTWTNRPSFKRVAAAMGIVGRLRCLEVTHGLNGWHSHFHVLLFTDKPVKRSALPDLEAELLNQWQSACIASGLPTPNEKGLTLSAGNAAAAGYVSKWGMAEEITKSVMKVGKRAGQVTPFGLLAAHAGGDTNAASLFREYAECFTGKRQMTWTTGMRKLLGLDDKEKKDIELAEEETEPATLFLEVPFNVFKQVYRNKARSALLAACQYGVDHVETFLCDFIPEEILDE